MTNQTIIVKIVVPEREMQEGDFLGECLPSVSWIRCRDVDGTWLPINRGWVQAKIKEGREIGWDQIPEECLVD